MEIRAVCKNGHNQTITCKGMSETQVRVLAGLMDGSSELYKYSPRTGPGSDVTSIGHCETCGELFDCEVIAEDAAK